MMMMMMMLCMLLSVTVVAHANRDQVITGMEGWRPIGTGLSQGKLTNEEQVLFEHDVPGVMTHFWAAGSPVVDNVTMKYYVDNETEAAIQRSLRRIGHNRTVIMIAHRLSTIRNADRICVMEEGRIVEEGTHEELLLLEGRYSQLHALQFRNETEEELGRSGSYLVS